MEVRSIYKKLPVILIAAISFALAGTAPLGATKYKPREDEGWVTYKNERFGYRFYYPSEVFGEKATSANSDGKTFLSKDGQAKIILFGAHNDENIPVNEYRNALLEDFGGYEQLDYQPKGKSWFVLSGIRENSIYYQKVMFSCSNKIVNVFSISFPTAEKPLYERLIEIMENHFKPGRGADAPQGC